MANAGKKAARSSKKAVAPAGKSKKVVVEPVKEKTAAQLLAELKKAADPTEAARLKVAWKAKKRAEIEANPVRQRRSQEWREGQKVIAAKFHLPPLSDDKPGRDQSRKIKRPAPEDLTEAAIEEFKSMIVMGVPIKIIAQYANMPSECKLWYATADSNSPIHSAYAHGKTLCVARLEEEIERVATTPQITVLRTKRQVLNQFGDVVDVVDEREVESVDHRRLVVDTLRWSLSHIMPRKHGKNAQGADEGSEQLANLFKSIQQGPAKSDG